MKKTVLTFCAVVGLGLGAMAQGSTSWLEQASGFATPSRGISDIDITSPTAAWAVAYDGTNPAASNVQDFTRTINGGVTWTAGTIGTAAANHTFSNISAVSADTAWVAMYNNTSAGGGKILKTTDGGVTWTHQSTATYTGPAGFPNIVHMFNANNGWTQGDPNGGYFEMYTTTNGGNAWTRVPSANIPAPLTGEYGLVDVYSTVGNTIYFGTNMGRVFKSINGGLNWTVTAPTGLTAISKIAFSSPQYGLIANGPNLYRTGDGGATWTQVQYGGTGTYYTFDLEYVPGTTNTFVSSGAAQGASGSSYSLDGGLTWTELEPTGTRRLELEFFSPTVGYVGWFNTDAVTSGIFKFIPATSLVGLSNEEFSKNVSVYPNPSNGVFNVEVSNGTAEVVSIKAIDALGRTVYTSSNKLEAGIYKGQVDFSHLGKGVYTFQVQTDENISVRKIVLQ